MDIAGDEDGYVIERAQDLESGFKKIATLPKNITSYLLKNETGYFRIYAFRNKMKSAFSNLVNSKIH